MALPSIRDNLDAFFQEWVYGHGYQGFTVAATYNATPQRVTLLMRALRAFLVGLIVCSACRTVQGGQASPSFVESPVPSAMAGISDQSDLITVVPFQLVDGFILVRAAMDEQRGDYLLDWGGPVSLFKPRPGLPPATGDDPVWVTVHTLRIGALWAPITNEDRRGNAFVLDHPIFHVPDLHAAIGTIGLNVLFPFEVIIDYPRQRLIMIRLDSAGHRRHPLPAYTAVATLPFMINREGGPHIYLQGQVGDMTETFGLDTGAPDNILMPESRQHLGTHLTSLPGQPDTYLLDRLLINGHPIARQVFSVVDVGNNILGAPFLRSLGVIGLNLQTQQFTVYREGTR